jgi:hypothetical protein
MHESSSFRFGTEARKNTNNEKCSSTLGPGVNFGQYLSAKIRVTSSSRCWELTRGLLWCPGDPTSLKRLETYLQVQELTTPSLASQKKWAPPSSSKHSILPPSRKGRKRTKRTNSCLLYSRPRSIWTVIRSFGRKYAQMEIWKQLKAESSSIRIRSWSRKV